MARVTRPWALWRTSSSSLTATGRGEARGGVWRCPGAEVIHPAGAGDEGRAEATRGGDALARPGLVVARSGASGTSLGTLGLARVLVLSVKGGHESTQGSVVSVQDTTVQG